MSGSAASLGGAARSESGNATDHRVGGLIEAWIEVPRQLPSMRPECCVSGRAQGPPRHLPRAIRSQPTKPDGTTVTMEACLPGNLDDMAG